MLSELLKLVANQTLLLAVSELKLFKPIIFLILILLFELMIKLSLDKEFLTTHRSNFELFKVESV
jgi:hypothetical protein